MTPSPQAHTALVLGGSSGLGLASARALASAGSRVIVTSRDLDRAEAVAASLGGHAEGLALDLTDATAVDDALVGLRAEGIDQLVLNSGGPKPASASDIEVADLRTALDSLLFAHVTIVKALLPSMLEAGWGRIVAVGSSGVQSPLPNLAASNIGRAALSAYLKTLSAEIAGKGVTVNMVLPGRIATDRVASLDEAAAARTGSSAAEVATASAAKIPTGRYGDPAEFAAAVAFLASDAASYVTGEQLRVDGGLIGAY